MVIGFDYDGTLYNVPHFENFIKLISPTLNEHMLFLLTSRDMVDFDMKNHISSLGLKIRDKDMFAIGKHISNGMFDSKAHYMKSMNMPCNMFFDNDPYEIEDLRKFGIPCLWVPELNKNSLMWEITENFFFERGKKSESY